MYQIVNMINIFAFLTILTVCATSAVESIFNKCQNDDTLNKCLINNINKGWPEFVKTYNLDKIPLETYQDMPNLLKLWLKNGYLEGFENIEIIQFYVNFENMTSDIIYSQPKMSVIGNYEILGNFLGVEFYDRGYGNGTYTNGIYKLHYDFDIEERDGDEYIELTTYDLSFEVDKLIVGMNSNVSAEEGSHLQALFNDYWRILNILSEGYVADFVSEAYTPIIQNYLDQVPFKSIFQQ